MNNPSAATQIVLQARERAELYNQSFEEALADEMGYLFKYVDGVLRIHGDQFPKRGLFLKTYIHRLLEFFT